MASDSPEEPLRTGRDPHELPCTTRRSQASAFFERHPGAGRSGLGLGLALVEFIDWMTDSGRLDDEAGSRWWRGMNGQMILDLATPSESWQAYVDADASSAQAALWRAHQSSIETAVSRCRPNLEAETDEEADFIGIVLNVVSSAARRSTPTDTHDLGATTRALYPDRYPITADQLVELRASLGI